MLIYVLSGGGLAYGLIVRACRSAVPLPPTFWPKLALVCQGSWFCLVYFYAIVGMEAFAGKLRSDSPAYDALRAHLHLHTRSRAGQPQLV